MQFHAYRNSVETLILDTEVDNMANYDKIDPATVAAKRRADIIAGRNLLPSMACHYCGTHIGKGALWCSTACAEDYAAERVAISSPPA